MKKPALLLLFSTLVVTLGVVNAVDAQFSSPGCLPPSCNPTVIQNVATSGTAQSASINITGDAKVGATLQAGGASPTLSDVAQNLMYGNVAGGSSAGNLMKLQVGAADRFIVDLPGNLTTIGDADVRGGDIRNTIGGVTITSAAGSPVTIDSGNGTVNLGAGDNITVPGNLTVTGTTNFTNPISGNGGSITNINAANITSGTISNSLLSSNVALTNANNTFTGMTSFGSAGLVAGTGQNVVYGVAAGTSAGNLMLLQTQSGGVYTDRFRVDAGGNVTATSFTGNGAGLTGISASTLAAGSYGNALTFSNPANVYYGNGANLTGVSASTLAAGTYGNALTFSNASNSFTGSGAGLTALNASNMTAGTLPGARLSGVYGNAVTFNNAGNSFTGTFSGNGASITSLNASNLTTGTVATARLGSGAASSSTYLRGDGTWATVTTPPEADTFQTVTARGASTTIPLWISATSGQAGLTVNSTSQMGIYGIGPSYGVDGVATTANGIGILGSNLAAGNNGAGVGATNNGSVNSFGLSANHTTAGATAGYFINTADNRVARLAGTYLGIPCAVCGIVTKSTDNAAYFTNASWGTAATLATPTYAADFAGSVNVGNGGNLTVAFPGYASFGNYVNVGASPGVVTFPWKLYVTGSAFKTDGSGSWNVVSDKRIKKDVADFTDGLDVIRKLHLVKFKYNGLANTQDGQDGVGVIAQEAQKIVPYMVQTAPQKLHADDAVPTELLSFNPSAMDYINANAIKTLDVMISEQAAHIKMLEDRIDTLERERQANR